MLIRILGIELFEYRKCRVVPFIIMSMSGIPILMIIRAYLKMREDDRKSVKGDFQKPRFIFTIGFILIGLLLSQLGKILLIKVINLIGITILAMREGVILKDTTDTNELENTLDAVNHLTEDDAKSLLRLIYGFVNTAMTGNGGDEVKLEVVHKVSDIYKRIPDLNELRNK